MVNYRTEGYIDWKLRTISLNKVELDLNGSTKF